MKMQKAIKKIVALGAGATMLGATLMGALAANDLASYPAPFVKDGKFDAFIVVGDKAAAEDVIGAVDVAAALQYSMKKEVVTAGTATTTVEGGAKIETSAAKLYYGTALGAVKSVITATELPVLLKTGKVTDSEGNTYDVKTQVAVPPNNATVQYGKSGAASDESEPVLYLDLQTSNPTYTIQVDFPTAANLTLANGKTITLLGKEYTLGSTSEVTSSKVTLYTAAVDQSFTAGQSATVNVGGSDVTVEVIGVNTQASTATATVKVNGESATVSSGNTYTIGSQKVYVKDIFAYTQPVGGGGVRLFIGSQKMVLEHGNPVTAGAAGTTTIDGTLVQVTSTSGKISRIAVNVTPYNVAPYPKLLKSGGSFTDPVFKAFKWVFGGSTPTVDSADKTPVKVYPSGENGLKLEFTNKNGQKYALGVVRGYSAASGAFDQNDTMVGVGDYQLVMSNNLNINKSDYFVLSTGEYQRILRLSSFVNSSNNQYITVKDVADGGGENQWTHNGATGTMIYDGTSYTFNVIVRGTSDGSLNFTSGVSNVLYTNNDMLITLPAQNSTGDGLTPAYINITERTGYSGGTVNDHGIVQLPFTYAFGRNGNDLQLSTPTYTRLAGTGLSVSFSLVGSSGYDYRALTPFGSLLKWNSDTSLTRFEGWTYPIETTFDVFLAPTEALTTVSGGGKTVTIDQIQVGSAKLASEIADVAAQNLILVGGPCANAAAAKVMGNPADCSAGFKDGEAMVKLYDTGKGKWALLVAGSSALDTRRASKAVASGKLSTVAAGTTEAKVTTVTDTPTITVVTPK